MAIERANAKLAKAGKAPVQGGVTNHTLRQTFASLLYEAGASPAYVMAQLGHTSSALALEVYARKMERGRDEALIGHKRPGHSGARPPAPRVPGASLRVPGRAGGDSM